MCVVAIEMAILGRLSKEKNAFKVSNPYITIAAVWDECVDILLEIRLGTKIFKTRWERPLWWTRWWWRSREVQACEEEMYSCIIALVRRCGRLVVVGLRRGRNRPKKYWGVVIRQDMTNLQLTEGMTLDRKIWRLRIRYKVSR